jgi:hypothetical protein
MIVPNADAVEDIQAWRKRRQPAHYHEINNPIDAGRRLTKRLSAQLKGA